MLHLADKGKPAPWAMAPLRTPSDTFELWEGLELALPFWGHGEAHVEDVSGNGLHGAFGTNLDSEADWKAGDHGPELTFGGNVQDRVSVADPGGDRLDGTTKLSVEVMFRASALSAFRGLVGKYRAAAGCRSWRLYYDAGQLELQVSSDGAAYEVQASTGLSLSTGTLYQVIATYDAGTFALYVNGDAVSVDGNFTSETSIFGGTEELVIAQRTTAGSSPADVFEGEIGSVRVWNGVVLTADQAALLWDQPFRMYVPTWSIPSLAVEHSGGAAAGSWSLAGEAVVGLEELLITGLTNGVNYDVQVKTLDETGNESSGSSILDDAPAEAASSFRPGRQMLVGSPAVPQMVRRFR